MRKHLLIYGIIGFLYGTVSYYGVWLYASVPVVNIILILPIFLVEIISRVLPVHFITGDLGQSFYYFDWLFVSILTMVFFILFGLVNYKIKN